MYHNQEELYYKAWRRLPERFRKPNNLNLYYVLYGGYGDIEKGFASISESRNIDKAKGETLDKLGANVGQFRLGEDDDLYRLLIKTRIIANMSIGDIPTLNTVISTLTKDIFLGLSEVWNNEVYEYEPAAIAIKLPIYAKYFPYDIVESIKAAGVRIIYEYYTFEKIILKEKTKTYTPKYWMVNEPPCGRVYRQAYRGKKFVDNIKMSYSANIRNNRRVRVNEIKSGGVVNK